MPFSIARPAKSLPLVALLAATPAGCVGAVGDVHSPGPGSGLAPSPVTPGATNPPPGTNSPPGNPTPGPDSTSAAFTPPPAGSRRLTAAQYRNSVRDLLGDQIRLPAEIEPDDTSAVFASIGGYRSTTSSSGVDLYQRAAFDLAAQVLAHPAARPAFLGCTPATATDPCVRGFLQRFGRRAWRRPVTPIELQRYQDLVAHVAALPNADVAKGLEAAVAGMLQSVNFLHVTEVGEPEPGNPSRRRLTGYEVASRLSYFLWDTTPDDALLAAAEAGRLGTAEGLAAEVKRLLASPRAHAAVRTFAREALALDRLATLKKDPAVFPAFTPALAASMGEELQRVVTERVFAEKADFLGLYDTRTTFVDAALAKLYGVPAPAGAGLQKVALPDTGPRAGLLALSAPLAITALSVRTSPTQRGVFVRERVLCEEVPPAPADVQPTIPAGPADEDKPLRQRLEQHRADPACAACHAFFDPLGFPLEGFDGIGVHRTTDRGAPLVLDGELDGKRFNGAVEMGQVLRQDPRAAACVVRHMYAFATGHEVEKGQDPLVAALLKRFQESRHDLTDLMAAIATSNGFRTVAAAQ